MPLFAALRQIVEYARWLGMDVDADRDLLYIAREGLKAPLPGDWKPCKTTDTEEVSISIAILPG